MTASEQSGDGLGVVVVNYGSHELLARYLVALQAGLPAAGYVVVDSYYSEAERREIELLAEAGGWRLVALADNRGFGAAANAGVSAAIDEGHDTVFLLNPDAQIEPEALCRLTRRSRSFPAAMITPRIERPDGVTWFDGAVVDRRTGMPGRRPRSSDEIPWLSAACLMTSATLWQRLGGFDEDYFMYWEDVDLSFRCVAAGGTLEVCRDVTAMHDVGATQGAGKSVLYVFHCCRNRLLFAAKHLSRREVARWILAAPRASWLIARRGTRRRVLLRSPRLLWAAASGTIAGLRHAVVGVLSV